MLRISVPVCAPATYKTVHRTVLLYGVCPLGFESPTYHNKKQEAHTTVYLLFFGGEKGIRTPETVLAPTRFPIVRLRPTQPSLHDLTIIKYFFPFVNTIF